MRIAVNTRLLLKKGLDGIGWYIYENLIRITRNHPEHDFIFIFDRPYSKEFIFAPNIIPVVGFPPARHPYLWYLFFDWCVPYLLKKHKADVFFSPDGWLSLRTSIPQLPVIHDLNFLHEPGWLERRHRGYCQKFFPKFIQKATRIATVSQFSKKDICERFNVSSKKVDVVYNGANENYVPISAVRQQKTKEKYTNGKDFFLFISSIHPRKNLKRQLHAFNLFKKATDCDMKFLVVGSKIYLTENTKLEFENSPYKNDIIFLGRVEGHELHMLIASCFALVYVSLFEGFGIPILEAMYCDKPIITSNTSSMPEVAGKSALIVDPYSVDEIMNAMLRLYSEEELANELIKEARLQRKKFSWDITAERTWNSIEQLFE